MRIPAFIKQLAKFCDPDAIRYALGGVLCKSDGKGVEELVATDGRIIACVHCSREDGDSDTLNVVATSKALASPPVAAFKKPVSFDGKAIHHDGSSTTVDPIEGRFPRYEDVFDPIERDQSAYVSVKLDGELLRKSADLAAAMNADDQTKGITLFVKDATSAVYASCTNGEGYVARMAIMPRASDEPHQFPARPGEAAVEPQKSKAKPKKELVVQNCTVYPDGRRVSGETVNVTTRKTIAPPPETLDDDAISAAVTREPECVGMAFSVPEIE
jgi:hypothetical protein